MSFFMRIVLFTVVLGLIQILMTKYLNRPLWRTRWGKRIVVGWPLASVLALVLWLAAVWTFDGVWWLDSLMRVIAAAFLVGVLALLLSSPVAGLLNAFEALRRRFTVRKAEPAVETVESPARRSFLQLGAIALPMATISASQSGVLTSFSGVKVFEMPVKIPNLPPQLEGLRILHLSDLHLGVFYHLGDLEELLTDLDGRRFDVVALIGDIADNLDDMPTALNLISQLPARYGHYATLGNHEYYRGLDRVLRTYERSPIPLLRNEGVKVDVDGATLVIGGADDPVGMGWSVDRSAFYRGAVEKSLDPAATGDTRILLSHRPGTFDYASTQDVELTLAGHTHGGQFGFFGRSVFDVFGDDLYIWGRYEKGASQLYTSSGVGHWFPFRLGCPAEAPIVILHRA